VHAIVQRDARQKRAAMGLPLSNVPKPTQVTSQSRQGFVSQPGQPGKTPTQPRPTILDTMLGRKPKMSGKQEKLSAAGPGPYAIDQAARVRGLDDQVASMSRNREQHPFHYLLNPYVPGPLSEILTRLSRRVAASRATSPVMAVTSAGAPFNPLSLAGYPAAALAGGPGRREKARAIYEKGKLPG